MHKKLERFSKTKYFIVGYSLFGSSRGRPARISRLAGAEPVKQSWKPLPTLVSAMTKALGFRHRTHQGYEQIAEKHHRRRECIWGEEFVIQLHKYSHQNC